MKMCPLWNGYCPTICKVAGVGLLESRTKTAAAETARRLSAAAMIHLLLLPLRGIWACAGQEDREHPRRTLCHSDSDERGPWPTRARAGNRNLSLKSLTVGWVGAVLWWRSGRRFRSRYRPQTAFLR